MKLLITPTDFNNEFLRLLKNYNECFWATAWASTSSSNFKELVRFRNKIKKIVVGLHFYQTHPDFINEFLNTKNVKFVKQLEGTFHPKVYLFQNNPNDWEMLIGSGNFTYEAFTHNTEAVILINSKSEDAAIIYKKAFELIDYSWEMSEYFDSIELSKYREIWLRMRPKRNSLNGTYGSNKPEKLIYNIPIINMTWNDFVNQVKSDKIHSLDDRIEILESSQSIFYKYKHYKDMPDDIRKSIAATYSGEKINGLEWKLFGSMWGAGDFKNAIIENYIDISKALDQIPLYGNLTKSHYDNFLLHFKKTFPTGNPLATATRLLAMKRPDTFVCIDNKNKKDLCKAFELKVSNLNIDNYWDKIIERIFDSNWWQSPVPITDKDTKIANFRSAFLDAIYYEP